MEAKADQGELQRLLEEHEERPLQDCQSCGGEGFILCSWHVDAVKMSSNRADIRSGTGAKAASAAFATALRTLPRKPHSTVLFATSSPSRWAYRARLI